MFHGVRQHIAAEFENELDNYGWVLQGQSAADGRNTEKSRTLSVTLPYIYRSPLSKLYYGERRVRMIGVYI